MRQSTGCRGRDKAQAAWGLDKAQAAGDSTKHRPLGELPSQCFCCGARESSVPARSQMALKLPARDRTLRSSDVVCGHYGILMSLESISGVSQVHSWLQAP